MFLIDTVKTFYMWQSSCYMSCKITVTKITRFRTKVLENSIDVKLQKTSKKIQNFKIFWNTYVYVYCENESIFY